MAESGYWVDEAGTAHERCKLLFFVGSDFLGEAEFDPGAQPDSGYRRGGVLYICRTCGEVWARIVLVNHKGQQQSFDEVSLVSCAKHADSWNIPGSLLEGYRNAAYLASMPEAALKREFEIHLQQAERESHGASQTGAQAA